VLAWHTLSHYMHAAEPYASSARALLALSCHTKQQDRGVIVQWLDRRLAPARGLENDISSFEWALRL
jgi:hypothetical protein